MTNLQGQVAIVTGGGTGIGRGIALALGQAGVKVVVCGRRPDPLNEVVQTIQGHGGTALAYPIDIAQETEVVQLVKTTLAQWGRIDILINNAGVFATGYIHNHTIEAWDRIMAINLRAPFLLARMVLPYMRQQKSGHIINISSESGIEYEENNGAYAVSKHALNALGQLMQKENQAYNIRVNTICPGMVVTEMSQNAPGLNRERCLYPQDIADLALWLVKRRANVKIGRPLLIQTMLDPWQD